MAKAGSIVGTVVALAVAFVLVRKAPASPHARQSTSILAPTAPDQELDLQ